MELGTTCEGFTLHKDRSRETIPTHGSLGADLHDLSGFGAVVDDTDDRLVMLGGGQTKAQNRELESLGHSMGRAPATEQPFCMLCLCRTFDGKNREEWKWSVDENHKGLQLSCRLPVRASWSACLMNHNIIPFGGCHGEHCSNETTALQLRPTCASAKEEIQENVRTMRHDTDELQRGWGPVTKKDVWDEVRPVLGVQQCDCIPKSPLQVCVWSAAPIRTTGRCERERIECQNSA